MFAVWLQHHFLHGYVQLQLELLDIKLFSFGFAGPQKCNKWSAGGFHDRQVCPCYLSNLLAISNKFPTFFLFSLVSMVILCAWNLFVVFRCCSIKKQKMAISKRRKKSHIVPVPCKVCKNFMPGFNPCDLTGERRKDVYKFFEG